jgi:hypothetical protein
MGKNNKNNNKNTKKGQKSDDYNPIFKENELVREFFKFAMDKFKIKEPVVFALRKNLANYGYYSFNGDKHYIYIKSSEPEGEVISSACHEIAHLLDYQDIMRKGKDDNDDPHSNSWGIKMAIVYRAYLEFMEMKEKEGLYIKLVP